VLISYQLSFGSTLLLFKWLCSVSNKLSFGNLYLVVCSFSPCTPTLLLKLIFEYNNSVIICKYFNVFFCSPPMFNECSYLLLAWKNQLNLEKFFFLSFFLCYVAHVSFHIYLTTTYLGINTGMFLFFHHYTM